MDERMSLNSESNPPAMPSNRGPEEVLEMTIEKLERELDDTKDALMRDRESKRRMYLFMSKMARELKKTRSDLESFQKDIQFERKRWYKGGMWRTPEVLPGLGESISTARLEGAEFGPMRSERYCGSRSLDPSDLFLTLVIVTAFSRVGVAVQTRGGVDAPVVAFFAVFWSIWVKETSYSSRFDATDLSSIVETMFTCFAVLFGCISCTETFQSVEATRIMMVAAFVAGLHFLLHYRVYRLYRTNTTMEAINVRRYARYIMWTTALEAAVWLFGILFVPVGHSFRWAIFLLAVLLGLRSPASFLHSDFIAETRDRNILFTLLLGFTLQSLVTIASPFFDYQSPNIEQYLFLGSACLLLFCIKLMYVDDSKSIEARDHAIFISKIAGFFFSIGQFCLLLAMTVLATGMDLLTHSYLAAREALPDNAKKLVCGAFSAIVLLNAFLKSLHIRRMPKDRYHQYLFYFAYGIQIVVSLTVVYVTSRMCFDVGFYNLLQANEIVMLFALSGAALFMVLISWLDEVVELSLYKDTDANRFRVRAFYLWPCLKFDDDLIPDHRHINRVQSEVIAMLTSSRSERGMPAASAQQYDTFKLPTDTFQIPTDVESWK